ncbi:MAG: hypothetical protein KAI47_25420 [Deltaproteobacteria bacterium]|nr:hypothetical protein [Deltaproteobacteria bacterium]
MSVIFLHTGCGLGLLQTAKTTPKGMLRVSGGGGYLYNANVEDRGPTLGNIPVQIALRYGVTDSLDVGARLFCLAGGLADIKYNLLSSKSPLALSVWGGIGAAANVNAGGAKSEGWNLHMPLGAIASYELMGWLTPYVGFSYGFWWIFGRGGEIDPNVRYASREGYGDGLLTITAGVELRFGARFALLLEYDLFEPVVDDPGDFYSFIRSHLVQVGFRY